MPRITRGDAEAVLNAFGTGGRVILRNGKTAEAHQRTSSVLMARSGRFGLTLGPRALLRRRLGT
jgi:hypothetical protein